MGKAENTAATLAQEFRLPSNPDCTMGGEGYNRRETNFVMQKLAGERNDTGHINTYDLLLVDKKDRKDSVFEIITEVSTVNSKLVVGDAFVYPHQPNGFQFLNMLMPTIQAVQNSPDFAMRRVVMPLTIAFANGEKENHGAALCIDKKPDSAVDIILLEQHARADASKLDFSSECRSILEAFKIFYEAQGAQVRTFLNTEPFCRETHVCGIVSLETCKRLLETEHPFEFAQDTNNLLVTPEQVQESHRRNIGLAKADPTFG